MDFIIGGVIGSATSDAYNKFKNLSKNTQFKKVLSELNIEEDIKILEGLIIDLKDHKNRHLQSVEICIFQIDELLKKIDGEISNIHKIIIEKQYGENSLLATYNDNVKNITKYKAKLNSRFDILIKLLSI